MRRKYPHLSLFLSITSTFISHPSISIPFPPFSSTLFPRKNQTHLHPSLSSFISPPESPTHHRHLKLFHPYPPRNISPKSLRQPRNTPKNSPYPYIPNAQNSSPNTPKRPGPRAQGPPWRAFTWGLFHALVLPSTSCQRICLFVLARVCSSIYVCRGLTARVCVC